ncbi:MAG: EamA family transporter [Brasilonema octagenarum HA4186-MV1]|jgi:drug/metabolite transporter (DMT)-like permease|uniref:EamA family transporter n=2 Tax=Brasilonema TaxID=383614 RepID=A0A856MDV0_9CYAN|nr:MULTISPECIES: DMT family transporter [Brasilonema]MBW4625424.1 EamA family transporter [Brasilonema octagenarum HA4186-MV1]NMF62789.1 EamA family transporter [Brasilonema octagenarum UFV-OR1]QDL08480.1 EamA family transporter [Brasilonema sennae CENA114]QDL14836.1 EamA family transporter [Brasilonema octagenarum UFV-E1]
MQTENALHVKGIILLIFINLVGATTFPLTKDIVSDLSPSALIATRFVLAAVFFAVNLRSLNALLLRDGLILGLLFFLYLATETIALQTIPANRAVFIASLSALIVPLLGWLSGQRVLLRTFLAAGLAAIGIGVMFWEGGELGIGDLLMFSGAVVYALYTLFIERVTSHHPTLSLTSVQLLFIGGLGALWSNSQVLNQFEAISQHWRAIVYLALVATAAVIWLQTLVQRWISASETALLYTIEPVFSAIFSFWLLDEHLGIRGIIGAIFVLAAVVLSQSAQKGEPDIEVKIQSS